MCVVGPLSALAKGYFILEAGDEFASVNLEICGQTGDVFERDVAGGRSTELT